MKIAVIEMTTARDPAVNLPILQARIRKAAAAGARLIGLPETCTFMEKGAAAMRARLVGEADSHELHRLRDLAKELSIYLLIGSMVLADEPGNTVDQKAVNRSLLISPGGDIIGRYDKIHMFDVTLENGETHRESQNYQAGSTAVLAPLDDLQLGMSICYDVRFPTLYRRLAQAGADIICVPSAFTQTTGAAHWHVLLRARAIETGCYVMAPAQVGKHENGRQTYGHSLIVNPWGKIIAQAEAGDMFVVADVDKGAIEAARRQIPSLGHGRSYRLPDGETQAHD
jgi:predicted amidohydrolase